MTLEKAYQVCKDITTNHYENFPVASRLLPANSRKHIYPIYAFARHADDLADEYADREGLFEWRDKLHRCMKEDIDHPIFIALADTIQKFDLPLSLFDDLLSAFIQDTEKTRYQDMAELLDYCKRSANPVGRIVLLLHNWREPHLLDYSDYICTALQLTNFWQDVYVDIQKERIYIPQDLMVEYKVSENMIVQRKFEKSFADLLARLVVDTREMFIKGMPLLEAIDGRLRWELRFTVAGGIRVLDKVEEIGYNVLAERPKLTKWDWMKISVKTLF